MSRVSVVFVLSLAMACRATPSSPPITAPTGAPPPSPAPADAATALAEPPDAASDVSPPHDATAIEDAAATSDAVTGEAITVDAASLRARLVFAQPDTTGPQRWADPWSVTLEVPSPQGPPRVYPVGDLTLTSPDYGRCPVRPGEVRRFDVSWGVGGGSYGLTLTLRARTIAWDFVEMTESDDPQQGGSQRHSRGRADVPAGVPADRVVLECR